MNKFSHGRLGGAALLSNVTSSSAESIFGHIPVLQTVTISHLILFTNIQV